MCDEWMPRLELPISFEQFQQLPRNAAYKYEYFHEAAWLNPRPRYYHALLDLEPWAERPLQGIHRKAKLRAVRPTDWQELAPLFSAAFQRQQPFCGLDDERGLAAAQEPGTHPQRRRWSMDRTSQLRRHAGRRRYRSRRHLGDAAARQRSQQLAQLSLEGAAAAGRAGALPWPAAFDVDLRQPVRGRPRYRHLAVERRRPRAARTGVQTIGQHVSHRQRFEHAVALAQRVSVCWPIRDRGGDGSTRWRRQHRASG